MKRRSESPAGAPGALPSGPASARRASPECAEDLRARIIGFGERSGRKSFYPELREREERLRAVFEGAAIGIGVTGPEGRLPHANRVLQDLLRHAAADLRGRPYLSLVHADG